MYSAGLFVACAGVVSMSAAPAIAVTPTPVVDSTSSVLDVDTGDADGVTTLADAVWLANSDPEADTITFDLDPSDVAPIDTVNVPAISEDVTISGPGRSRLTLTGSTGEVLRIENDASLTLSDVTIDGATAGFGPFDGVLLDAFDEVVLERVDIANVARGVAGTQPGTDPVGSFSATAVDVSTASAQGFSLTLVGEVTLTDVEVTDAQTTAGIAIESATTVSVTRSRVADSIAGLSVRDVGDVSITGLTASNNDGHGVEIREVYGGATLTGLTVSGNSDLGIRVDGSGAMPPTGVDDVRDVSVEASTIDDNDGGGISIESAGDIRLTDLEVTNNGVAPSSGLGGIYLGADNSPSVATIERSTIAANFGSSGGGLTTSNHDGELTVSDSTFSGNQAGTGSAMRIASIASTGSVVVERSVIIEHTVGTAPVVYDDGVTMRVVDSTVTANVAPALFEAAESNGISIRNSTVTANTVSDAVFRSGSFAFIEAIETTVSGNTATGGAAGVFTRTTDGGQLIAVNSILTGNGVPVESGTSIGPEPAVTYSLVPAGTAAGTGNVVAADPALGRLRDNGGPTHTMLPSVGSPAVDVGDPAGSAVPTDTDQRGLTRVVNGRVDMGAVERQESPFVVGLPPARILETRVGPNEKTIDGLFEGIGRRLNGQELELPVAGRAGVPTDAEAVVVNVTAISPSAVGFVTVHPCLVNPPLASSLNFRPDAESGNEIVAEFDADGELCLFNRSETDLVVDVVGYVPANSRYSTVGPARLLDTRDFGVTVDGLFARGGIRESDTELALDVAGRGGVSDDAVAVVVNVTAVKPVSVGYVTVHPCLPDEPTAASLNFAPGVNRGNEVIAQVDDQGRICLYTFGSAQLVVDVVGQLTDENVYSPVPPARLVETRSVDTGTIDGQQQAIDQRAAGSTLRVAVSGRAQVPGDAGSVVVNVTAIRPELRGFITVWDCRGSMPLAASLNHATGEIVGNELVVALDGGEFCVFTSRRTDLTVDVVAHLG